MTREVLIAQTFGPLTQDRLITLLLAVLAALIASAARVGQDRAAQRRQQLPLSPAIDMLPDIVFGSMSGICLALFVNWVKPIDAEATWLFAMLGGAAGPPLMNRILRAAAGHGGVRLDDDPKAASPRTRKGDPPDDDHEPT